MMPRGSFQRYFISTNSTHTSDPETMSSEKPSEQINIIEQYNSTGSFTEPRWEARKNPQTWNKVMYKIVNCEQEENDELPEVKTVYRKKVVAPCLPLDKVNDTHYILVPCEVAPTATDLTTDHEVTQNYSSATFITRSGKGSEYSMEPSYKVVTTSASPEMYTVRTVSSQSSTNYEEQRQKQDFQIQDNVGPNECKVRTVLLCKNSQTETLPAHYTSENFVPLGSSAVSTLIREGDQWETSNDATKPNVIYVKECDIDSMSSNTNRVTQNISENVTPTIIDTPVDTVTTITTGTTATTNTIITRTSAQQNQQRSDWGRREEPRSRVATTSESVTPELIGRSFSSASSIQESPLPANIQETNRYSSSSSIGSIRPTWIIKRHKKQAPVPPQDVSSRMVTEPIVQSQQYTMNTDRTKQNEYEIQKHVKREPVAVMIDDWSAANAKRIQANRVSAGEYHQIPYKSPTASVAFKETLEGYERVSEMQSENDRNICASAGIQSQVRLLTGNQSSGAASSSLSLPSSISITSNDAAGKLNLTKNDKEGQNFEIKGNRTTKEEPQIAPNTFNMAFKKYTEAVNELQQPATMSGKVTRRSKSSVCPRTGSTKYILATVGARDDDENQKQVTPKESLVLDTYRHARAGYLEAIAAAAGEEKKSSTVVRRSRTTTPKHRFKNAHQENYVILKTQPQQQQLKETVVQQVSEGHPTAESLKNTTITKRITYRTVKTIEERDSEGRVINVTTRTISGGSENQEEPRLGLRTNSFDNAFTRYSKAIVQPPNDRNSIAAVASGTGTGTPQPPLRRTISSSSGETRSGYEKPSVTVKKLNIDESTFLKSTASDLKNKNAVGDLSPLKGTFQKAFSSYEQALTAAGGGGGGTAQQREFVNKPQTNNSEVINREVVVPAPRNSVTAVPAASVQRNSEERGIREIVVSGSMDTDPSTATFSYGASQNNQNNEANEDGTTKKGTVIIRSQSISPTVPNALSEANVPTKRPVSAEYIATVVPDEKQTVIRTQLSRVEETQKADDDDDDDDVDPFAEEQKYHPDWVTSTFRLGSIRRCRSKKSDAMLRMQKEIELEKQRRIEMDKKMHENTHTSAAPH